MPIKIRADCSKRNKNKQMPLRERNFFFLIGKSIKLATQRLLYTFKKVRGERQGSLTEGTGSAPARFVQFVLFLSRLSRKKVILCTRSLFLKQTLVFLIYTTGCS